MMDAAADEGATTVLSLDNWLCFAVYSTGHAFKQFYRRQLEAFGLTYPQYLVLATLRQRDDQMVKEIGETLCLDSSTLTPLLKRLETAGFLTRTRDPDDERQVRVRLTEEGGAMWETARTASGCAREAVGLSEEEAGRLLATVLGIRDRLTASPSRPADEAPAGGC